MDLLWPGLHRSGTLFTDEAVIAAMFAVEAAWAVVDPVLADHPAALRYPRGSWGPPEADRLAAAHGGWRNPEIR